MISPVSHENSNRCQWAQNCRHIGHRGNMEPKGSWSKVDEGPLEKQKKSGWVAQNIRLHQHLMSTPADTSGHRTADSEGTEEAWSLKVVRSKLGQGSHSGWAPPPSLLDCGRELTTYGTIQTVLQKPPSIKRYSPKGQHSPATSHSYILKITAWS
jgi:hypothetical protein